MKKVVSYISSFEDLFIQDKLDVSLEEQQKEIETNKKLLSQYEKRAKDIDSLIQHIYEDNISGKITDDRFSKLSQNYENEQKDLQVKITELAEIVEKSREESSLVICSINLSDFAINNYNTNYTLSITHEHTNYGISTLGGGSYDPGGITSITYHAYLLEQGYPETILDMLTKNLV